ncbi:unnamed protein product [Aspergillus oryzae]|nr:unnamed protein product [Aspergillus oryzae]GMF95882.1 unnamed protein product [Aspergillus oryzae]
MSTTKNAKGNRVEYHYWDYSFEWTDEHRPASEFESWIHSCDGLADECNQILNDLPAPVDDEGGNVSKRDRYALLTGNREKDPKLEELWNQINTVPEWVNWAQIQRGQDRDPSYYDVQKYGLPINDLDAFATINTYSSTVIWLGLPRQGIHLSNQEMEDYIALWRLVAWYMGAPAEPFESAAKAKIWSESLLINEFAPTDTGRILAKNIVIGMENTAPTYASKEFMDALARLLNGDQLSDELHIPQTSLYYRMLMWGYCLSVKLQAKALPNIGFIEKYVFEVWNPLLHFPLPPQDTDLVISITVSPSHDVEGPYG